MKKFVPGALISTFTLRDGRKIILRYPKWEDFRPMTEYINELSNEDTFISYSGEQNSYEDESKYLSELLRQHEFDNAVTCMAFDGNVQIGKCDIIRVMEDKTRKRHIGLLALSVKKNYRRLGLGELLMRSVIGEAKKNLTGLKIVMLEVYGPNYSAQALYSKIGFKEYGKLTGGVLCKGDYIDNIFMMLEI